MSSGIDELQLENNLARMLGEPEQEPIRKDWTYVIVFMDNTKKEVSGFACPVPEFKFLIDEKVKDKSSHCRLSTIMAKERVAYYMEYYRDE